MSVVLMYECNASCGRAVSTIDFEKTHWTVVRNGKTANRHFCPSCVRLMKNWVVGRLPHIPIPSHDTELLEAVKSYASKLVDQA